MPDGREMPELSIIIVNWNSLAYLRDCLPSLYANSAGCDFEVVVVDNASTGDDAQQIAAEFPQVCLIRSEKNIGFARANNLGFERCSGKYVLFLNPDTKMIGPAIARMLERLKSLPDAGIVGCKLLNTDGTIQTSSVQRFPTILNQMLDIEFLRLRWHRWNFWGIAPLFTANGSPVEVEVVSGACLMIRRDIFAQLGGFSTAYFMYAEDVELCYQTQRAGKKAYYVGDATVIHYGGGSSKRRGSNQWTAIMQRRALLLFCQRTHGRAYAAAFRLAMGFVALCRLAVFALLFPFRNNAYEKRILHSAPSKWIGVLKWAVGLDRISN